MTFAYYETLSIAQRHGWPRTSYKGRFVEGEAAWRLECSRASEDDLLEPLRTLVRMARLVRIGRRTA